MPSSKKTPATDQSKVFAEAARALGCDDDENAFDAKLKKVASAPSKGSSKQREKRKPR